MSTTFLTKAASAAEYHAILVKLRAQKRGKPKGPGEKKTRQS